MPPQRYIVISKPPSGLAQDWVRQAWVGLNLPVAGPARSRNFVAIGSLSGPQSAFDILWSLLRGKGRRGRGYFVYAGEAVDLLAESDPRAAQWWRENVPHLLKRRRLFAFNEDACTLIDA